MRIVAQSYEILRFDDMTLIERAGRTCYKSEDKITADSAPAFAERMFRSGHHAMLEHGHATVRLVTDRGVTHEQVRHRLASYGQESTRYCDYVSGHLTYIQPAWCSDYVLGEWHADTFTEAYAGQREDEHGLIAMLLANERDYKYARHKWNWPPEQARGLLAHFLKTEIVVTANFREWLHIFRLRVHGTTGRPHPQIRALLLPVQQEFAHRCPELFDIGE